MAHNGPESLDLASRNSYKLAPLDFHMPGMSGVELFARQRSGKFNLARILISAFMTGDAEIGALAGGIQQIFTKPVDLAALLPLIQDILSST